VEDQATTRIWRARQPDIVPKVEIRSAIASRFTSSAEPQTRLFWV